MAEPTLISVPTLGTGQISGAWIEKPGPAHPDLRMLAPRFHLSRSIQESVRSSEWFSLSQASVRSRSAPASVMHESSTAPETVSPS